MFRRVVVALCLLLVSCARLDYDRLGLHDNVVRGGQAEIDQGLVVRVDLPGIWIAAHRTSAGGAFGALTGAQVGDRVCVYSQCYTVFQVYAVPHSYIVTHELAPLVLQTSLPGDNDLLVLCR